MAERNRRIRPAGRRKAARLGVPTAALLASARAPLSASPAEVRAAGDEMAALRGGLGGPDVLLPGRTALGVSHDPRAYIKAQRAAGALSGSHGAVLAVVKETGIDGARLSERSLHYNAAVRLRSTAEIVAEAMSDSKALVQRTALRMSRDVIQLIERRIAALPPGDPARVRLEAQAARLLEKVRRLRDAQAARAAETRALGKEQAARKKDTGERLTAAAALAELADGKAVPAVEAARLMAILVPKPDKAPSERRTGPR